MSGNKMKTSTSITSLSSDILFEILTRLPPKSAMRFKCVSKSFYSLIPQPQFSFTILLSVPTITHYDRMLNLHTMSYSEESQANLQANRLQHLDLQRFRGGLDSSFAEGKICLISSDVGEAAVYDLSTREHISLPPVDPISRRMINSDSNCTTIFTCAVLGFDSVSKIYKILKTELYYDRRSRDEFNRLWVLTVGVDESWRNINPVLPAAYLDGHLHIDGIIYLIPWGAELEIAAFDVRTESFELIPFPYHGFPYVKYGFFRPQHSPWINLNNRLAFIHIFKQDQIRAEINIWRLEKPKEWVKHVVPLPLEVNEIIGQAATMGFTSNSIGEILIFVHRRNMLPMILVYAFGRQVWRKFEICGLHDYLYLHNYWTSIPPVAHVVEEKVYFSE